MRNLFLFFVRFNSFFIFLFLEGVCLFLIVRNNSYHRASFINSSNVITGNVYRIYDDMNSYVHLKAINDSLLVENAHLRTHPVVRYRETEQDQCELENNGLSLQKYTYVPAKVINNTADRINNYLTLDKGRKDGIAPEMAVIGASGIIGIVHHVSENFASVMSVLNKNSKVSVKLKRFNYLGNLEWNGTNPHLADLMGVPQYLPVSKGDSVVTSGYSAIFPQEIPVGVIESFEKTSGSNFYEVKVRLSTNFETVRYAYVVNYKFKDEQKRLELKND